MSSIFGVARTRSLCPVVFLVSMFSSGTPTLATGQGSQESAAIHSRIEAYLGAWNEHDAAALGALFSADADFVMGDQPEARGRQEIQAWWKVYFENQEPERRLELEVGLLRFLAPDVAIMTVTTTTVVPDSRGQDLRPRKFRGTWLWEHQEEAWFVSAMRGLPLEEDQVTLNASPEAAKVLRPDIRAFVASYEDALATQDPGAVSALYMDDAELIVRDSPLVTGRESIQAWWRSYFEEPRPYRPLLIIDEIRMIAPAVALLNITATGAVPQRGRDEPAPVRYARATWVLAKEAGEWRIAQLLVLPSEHDRIIRSGGR